MALFFCCYPLLPVLTYILSVLFFNLYLILPIHAFSFIHVFYRIIKITCFLISYLLVNNKPFSTHRLFLLLLRLHIFYLTYCLRFFIFLMSPYMHVTIYLFFLFPINIRLAFMKAARVYWRTWYVLVTLFVSFEVLLLILMRMFSSKLLILMNIRYVTKKHVVFLRPVADSQIYSLGYNSVLSQSFLTIIQPGFSYSYICVYFKHTFSLVL
jgi:hypothetical protein